MVEPMSIQLQWFHMQAPLTIWPQQHILCTHVENQLLKSCTKLHYHKFLAPLPQTM